MGLIPNTSKKDNRKRSSLINMTTGTLSLGIRGSGKKMWLTGWECTYHFWFGQSPCWRHSDSDSKVQAVCFHTFLCKRYRILVSPGLGYFSTDRINPHFVTINVVWSQEEVLGEGQKCAVCCYCCIALELTIGKHVTTELCFPLPLLVLLFILRQVSLHCLDWSWSHCVTQAGRELRILLPQPPVARLQALTSRLFNTDFL